MTEPKILYDLDEAAYHADPCDTPSLSASLAHLMVSASPLHAWTASRKLNSAHESVDTPAFNIGRAFHSLILDERPRVRVREEYGDWPDWRSKEARKWRDDMQEAGEIVLTKAESDALHPMRVNALKTLKSSLDTEPEKLPTEVSLIWEAGGVTNRARVDAVDVKNRIAVDLKTTAGLADPQLWVAASMDHGIDLRAAHYLDGLEACFPWHTPFRGSDDPPCPSWRYIFLVVEKSPPHACSLVELDERTIAMGLSKLMCARRSWGDCLKLDDWPAWSKAVQEVSAPEWRVSQWINELSEWGAEIPEILERDGEIEA